MTHNGPEVSLGTIRFSAITLCAGAGSGALLTLAEPLSFWGGTDRNTGAIIDTHHPQRGALLGGTVLLMAASRGSSSSSSVLAEQLRAGVGPSAIVLTARDAIVCLGVLAAAELYGSQTPVVLLTQADADTLGRSAGPAHVSVTAALDGSAAVVLTLPAQGLLESQP
ncbi:aconitase X swivel domain-containing protein [Arthrobacter psychrolactophilus]